MTTPERLRRRQRREGAALLVLAGITISYGVWDSLEARDRDECIARNFSDLTDVFELRAELTDKTAAVTLRSDALQEAVIEDIAAATSSGEVSRAFAVYRVADALLDKEQAELTQQREDAKIPPFPTGTCE